MLSNRDLVFAMQLNAPLGKCFIQVEKKSGENWRYMKDHPRSSSVVTTDRLIESAVYSGAC